MRGILGARWLLYFLLLCSGQSLLFKRSFWSSRLDSTSQLNRASEILKVRPPWNAPAWVWKFAWEMHQRILPWLHITDRCHAKESCVNLPVLWWKAIAGNRRGTVADDGGYAFDLLPSITRNLVRWPLCFLYPDLHHQNVLLRTLYLNKALMKELTKALAKADQEDLEVCLISLGAGFDTRNIRLLNGNFGVQFNSSRLSCMDLDLSDVVSQKHCMLTRLTDRRGPLRLPTLHPIDLNDNKSLSNLLTNDLVGGNKRIFVIMVEAVLLYLLHGQATAALTTLVQHCKNTDSDLHFIFADRLPYEETCSDNEVSYTDIETKQSSEVEVRERALVEHYLSTLGLQLQDWLPKPGKAKHMGVAILV
eukprot:scaffold3058_cov165-Ochromonas_danica.AAC.9